MSEQPHAEHAAPAPHVNYLLIFGALIVLTILSFLADKIGEFMGGPAHAPAGAHATAEHAPAAPAGFNWKILVGGVVLAIACAKATFVLLYFMHVKFEGKWIWAMLLPTLILALAIPAALTPDVALHYYTVQTPQADAYAEEHTAHPEHPETHPHEEPATKPAEKTAHPETKPAEGKHP